MPTIPNTMKKKAMKAYVFASSGIDCRIIATMRLSSFKRLTERNGLMTRIARKTLNAARLLSEIDAAIMSIQLIITTKKSIMFQLSRKYAFLCCIMPMAMIFKKASKLKIIKMMN